MAPRKTAKKAAKKVTVRKPSDPALAKTRSRASRHKLIFNLYPDEYDKIWEFQGKKCPITGKTHGNMCVDHDHYTGKVRGILNWQINKALGHFKDNPQWLRAAADYLDNNPATAALGEEVYGVMGSVGRKRRIYGPNKTKTPHPRKPRSDD